MAQLNTGFHTSYEGGRLRYDIPTILAQPQPGKQTWATSFEFNTHFHPYVQELVDRLIERSVRGLQSADTEFKRVGGQEVIPPGKPQSSDYELFESEFFKDTYGPSADLVAEPFPTKELDFAPESAYGVYNWELFYHLPLTIAVHLMKNQRFEEAQNWLHSLFDPTDDSGGPTPERFWKVKPFQTTVVQRLDELLTLLASEPQTLTADEKKLRESTILSLQALENNPFRPHVVARYRQTAYMHKAVMTYLDNLIGWGDSLFRQDTRESINEAMQLYVSAANILGLRPQAVPKKHSVAPQTYAALRDRLDAMGNALVEVETNLPFDLIGAGGPAQDSEARVTTRSIGQSLYFCVPRNQKLLKYWDTVADRLFKIRNSLNLQGVFRQLPLFEPPIDPAMLARAAASGVDVASVISGVGQPMPHIRFSVLLQKAQRLAQEVKSLGGQLLSAIEKEDGEVLSLLRVRHESALLKLTEQVRYAQWQEASKAREGLEQSLKNALDRHVHYERLLGEEADQVREGIPDLDGLDTSALESLNFQQQEPPAQAREIDVDIVPLLDAVTGGRQLSSHEAMEMGLMISAQYFQTFGFIYDVIGGALGLIPQIHGRIQPWGLGAGPEIGGEQLRALYSTVATAMRGVADFINFGATMSAKIGGYARREQDWALQSNIALGEVNLVLKQLRAAQIREHIAEHEFRNHQQQIEHSEQTEEFLRGEEIQHGDLRHQRTGTRDFYAWMRKEALGLHAACFDLAFDIARKAELALQHELGDHSLRFIEYGYMSGKQGLFAGERLSHDLMRMEAAYDELNRRELELTRHASLLQLAPVELLKLRSTGRCTLTVPESFFDLGGAGEYFRRIKTVAVSVPCVTGPYTTVNCTLRLIKSSVRLSPDAQNGYQRTGPEDTRFNDHFGQTETIVTSQGQSDSGLFETNLREERRLPFEGAGAISQWQLELPANPAENEPLQFDYDTIADVILHIRYTARDGGQPLKTAANAELAAAIDQATTIGSTRMFSIRHEFPTAWAQFQQTNADPNAPSELTLELKAAHFPFWSRNRLNAIHAIDVFAPRPIEVGSQADGSGEKDTIDTVVGTLRQGSISKSPLPHPPADDNPQSTTRWTVYLSGNSISDLWIAVRWGARP